MFGSTSEYCTLHKSKSGNAKVAPDASISVWAKADCVEGIAAVSKTAMVAIAIIFLIISVRNIVV